MDINFSDNDYVEFENIIDKDTLRDINLMVDQSCKGEGFVSIVGDALSPTIEKLRSQKRFSEAENSVKEYLKSTDSDLNEWGELFVLRGVNPKCDEAAYKKHTDSHRMTLLIPLLLSDEPFYNGNIILYKSDQRDKGTILTLFQKLRHKIFQKLPFNLRKKLVLKDVKMKNSRIVSCKPGNVYFFNGERTAHCNMHVLSGERRSLLIHNFDPQKTLGISSRFRSSRIRSNQKKY